MPKTLVGENLGGPGTPQEVKDLRMSSFEFHQELGFAVVHKHRWNTIDLREGRAQRCPLHDDLYGAAPANCPICFGTGFVGGFSDATICYVQIADAPTDTIKITPTGLLQMDQHPTLSAPWQPLMGDGDLIILADFEPGGWGISNTHERYLLRTVSPNTYNGPGWGRRSSTVAGRYVIGQQANADKLPYEHEFYNVPIIYDYADVPPDVTPPGEVEPPAGGSYSAVSYGIRIIGAEERSFTKATSYNVRLAVAGTHTSASRGVGIVGDSEGTHVHLP